MQLRLGLSLTLSVFSLAGCSSLAVNNGSLDYKETTSLEALQYPEGTLVRPATPLYPAQRSIRLQLSMHLSLKTSVATVLPCHARQPRLQTQVQRIRLKPILSVNRSWSLTEILILCLKLRKFCYNLAIHPCHPQQSES